MILCELVAIPRRYWSFSRKVAKYILLQVQEAEEVEDFIKRML